MSVMRIVVGTVTTAAEVHVMRAMGGMIVPRRWKETMVESAMWIAIVIEDSMAGVAVMMSMLGKIEHQFTKETMLVMIVRWIVCMIEALRIEGIRERTEMRGLDEMIVDMGERTEDEMNVVVVIIVRMLLRNMTSETMVETLYTEGATTAAVNKGESETMLVVMPITMEAMVEAERVPTAIGHLRVVTKGPGELLSVLPVATVMSEILVGVTRGTLAVMVAMLLKRERAVTRGIAEAERGCTTATLATKGLAKFRSELQLALEGGTLAPIATEGTAKLQSELPLVAEGQSQTLILAKITPMLLTRNHDQESEPESPATTVTELRATIMTIQADIMVGVATAAMEITMTTAASMGKAAVVTGASATARMRVSTMIAAATMVMMNAVLVSVMMKD